MTTLNAPPQAYTRETLAQAYLWLKSQPDLIKQRAKNADALVSLYLHACRHGLDVFKEEGEPLRSSLDFKNTLKNLSEGMKQFEGNNQSENQLFHATKNNAPVSPISPVDNPPFISSAQSLVSEKPPKDTHENIKVSNDVKNPTFDQPVAQNKISNQQYHPKNVAQPRREPSPAYRAYFLENNESQVESFHDDYFENEAPNVRKQSLELDQRSAECLRRTMKKLNLSSENEALRVLISMGYDRFKTLF